MPRSAARRRYLGLAVLLTLNLAIVAVAWLFRQTVVPGWKKGPLIDPAAPYSPENAQVLFAVAACLALDAYVLMLATWRRGGRALRAWVPWVALLLAGLLSEGVIRAWLAVDMVTYFRPDPELHWVVRSDLRGFDNLTGGGTITTNHDGLRMPGPDAVRERGEGAALRVVVLGDSSNFGHGVEGDETWAAVLEELLAPRVEVINAATPGWTTFQAVQLMQELVPAYHPDLVIAGFNNDPGPDYLHDADRVLPPGPRRALNRVLWRSEVYLLSREVLLSLLRRLNPQARALYTERRAGEDPKYGRLSDEEAGALVPRVPLPDFEEHLRTLDAASAALGAEFAWIDMPINRREPELVERYVDWGYREASRRVAAEVGFPVVEVDALWARQRARDLHVEGHVFHPNAAGHRRMAAQIGAELVAAGLLPGPGPALEGPPPAPREQTLRLGWSSQTPVHAHVGVVLEAMPELAARHGLDLALSAYASGKEQGEDVARGALDAFFTCEVPALHMLLARPDARIVSTPGALGRIAVVGAGVQRLEQLRGRRVGLAPGSTPAMDWQRLAGGLDAQVVELDTDALEPALARGEVDAIVGWDPWVTAWLAADPARRVLAEREFRSVLAVGEAWALPLPAVDGAPRAARLRALVEEALRIAAADRPRWDAAVARRSGWPVEVVAAVADRNELLAGRAARVELGVTDHQALDRAALYVGRPDLGQGALFGLPLLEGRAAPRRPGRR